MRAANLAAPPVSAIAMVSAFIPSLYHECDPQRNTNVIPGRNTNVIARRDAISAMKTLAERLVWARHEANLSQTEVATRAKVRQGTIGNIESGHRTKPRDLVSIARAVDVLPEWLSDGKGPVRQRAGAPAAAHDWPFNDIDPARWAALPERIKGVAEQAAIRAILDAEANAASLATVPAEVGVAPARSSRKRA